MLTSGALLCLHATSPAARGRAPRSPCSSPPTSLATALRFALYRGWVFGRARWRPPPGLARACRPPHSTETTPRRSAPDEHRYDRDPASRAAARPRRGPPAAAGSGAGRHGDPRLGRPALFGLLAGTALLYLWDLSRNGYANDFYAAAVQAGTRSWKAFFFGSFDSSSFITVDKTPASLWVDELSARIFGFGSWSLLVPQALEGMASVLRAVRRGAPLVRPGAGLMAGAVLALTPAAALMFRFNNPDALLVLLMTAAAYACSARSSGTGPAGWCWPGCCSASRS